MVIPGGALEPGRRYRVELQFARLAVNDVQSLPGSRIAVGAVRVTGAPLATAGGPPRPEIRVRAAAPGQFSLAVVGPQGIDWLLERAGNPAGPWNPVIQFQCGPVPWEFTDDATLARRFYRVRKAP